MGDRCHPTRDPTGQGQDAGARLRATFLVADALRLERLGRTFDAVVDSGLFHIFSDKERRRCVSSLRTTLAPNGWYHVLCFSEREPADWGGPRRVTQAEIRRTFARGWRPFFGADVQRL